ncbi:transposase, partial [Syntrophomonas wolfei]|uniref:transposase n=1 Tax=Syntrophomonas wolfei TaxID=863 RepID=UPI000A7B3D5B
EEYRKRAKIEPKNAELKRFHGLDRAKGYGLRSIRIQAKLTALSVNLKRIAKLVSALNGLHVLILKLLSPLVVNRPDCDWVAAQAA